MVLFSKQRIKEKLKMQSNFRQAQFNTIAKQGGVMPSYWLAINSISLHSDRTPEIVGSTEGWDG